MDKQVILAVAGAGKTYYICHQINPEEKNLILAYTHENIHNINRELMKAYGEIPKKTTVITFDSFIYRYIICPYEPSILEYFSCVNICTHGITTIDPPRKTIKRNGRSLINHLYVSQKKIGHYINNNQQYYCKNLSELVMQIKFDKELLVKRVADTLNIFFDCVLIDEFQDFREYNYELIIKISKYINRILLVGDYYQHSVSGSNNSGKPFKKQKNNISYQDFINNLEKEQFVVNTSILQKSRRCSESVCSFIKRKLSINIESEKTSKGNIEWVTDNAKEILDSSEIIKLVYREAKEYSFPAMNWSYTKGDTLGDICVILTDTFEDIDQSNFNIMNISQITINKLYVALTRTNKTLYLMKASVFKKFKEEYIKM